MKNTAAKERVWLSIKGCFGSEDATGNAAEFLTEGDYYVDAGTPTISYEEYPLGGMGRTTTTIKFDQNRVSVTRLGDVTSIMEFIPGKHNTAMYCTPYGDVAIDTFTKNVEVAYDDDTPSKIQVEYDLTFGPGSDSNTIDIEIRSPQKKLEKIKKIVM